MCQALGPHPIPVHYWLDQLIPELNGQGITDGVIQGQVLRQLLRVRVTVTVDARRRAAGSRSLRLSYSVALRLEQPGSLAVQPGAQAGAGRG